MGLAWGSVLRGNPLNGLVRGYDQAVILAGTAAGTETIGPFPLIDGISIGLVVRRVLSVVLSSATALTGVSVQLEARSVSDDASAWFPVGAAVVGGAAVNVFEFERSSVIGQEVRVLVTLPAAAATDIRIEVRSVPVVSW